MPSLEAMDATVTVNVGDFEVLDSVVASIAVPVVDVLVGRKLSAEMNFEEATVLLDAFSIDPPDEVAVGVDGRLSGSSLNDFWVSVPIPPEVVLSAESASENLTAAQEARHG